MTSKPSMWEMAKAGAANAAAATQRTAKRTKLKTEIQMLNRDIRAAKADFGVLAYDLVVAGDFQGAADIANEKKYKIDNWTQTVQAKRDEIKRLNDEAAAAGEKVPPKSEYEEETI